MINWSSALRNALLSSHAPMMSSHGKLRRGSAQSAICEISLQRFSQFRTRNADASPVIFTTELGKRSQAHLWRFLRRLLVQNPCRPTAKPVYEMWKIYCNRPFRRCEPFPICCILHFWMRVVFYLPYSGMPRDSQNEAE